MKYKEGEIPPEMLAVNASNDMLVFTAVISLIIGITFLVVGLKAKQLWMWTWGIGLSLSSVYLWLFLKYDFRPFSVF